jgi:hypothetical protein
MPTVVFELYKLAALGGAGYIANWRDALAGFTAMGLQHAGPAVRTLVAQRLPVIHEVFSVYAAAAAMLAIIAAARMLWAKTETRWIALFFGLLVSIASATTYWLGWSIGRPRYLLIAVTLACFALVIPALTLRRLAERLAWTCSAVFLVGAGIRHLPAHVRRVADRGVYAPSSQRVARIAVVKKIEQIRRQGPTVLATQWWATGVDVEFALRGSTNLRRIEALGAAPGRKLVVLNRAFAAEGEPALAAARQQTKATVFSAEG